VFDDPLNFKKFDIPDDYFEMRRSTNYWAKQKEKEENDKRRFAVVQVPKKRKDTPVLSSLRDDPSDDISKIVRGKQATEADLP